ncbi:uncharacterized protein LOC134833733 [Culicoides brevitarsis]|uniref:uncharacterized protein LOC134833733 n=1 Tax=Culicoides brevitarsis TaxID=469753 RepID=UPI00307C4689
MLITGIGDEVTNFFIILVIFCVIYFGWRSTAVTPASSPVGVLIIEQNTRFTSAPSNNNTPENRELTRSDSQLSTRTETEELTVNNVIEELENDITDFIGRSSSSFDPLVDENHETTFTETGGEEQIIEAMDGDVVDNNGSSGSTNDGLRHRKVTGEQGDTTTDKTESKDVENDRELTIKLKYLNDDLKLVTAKASEAIGDFKKRNFTVELAAQKLVRLVFNGHVLQHDKTLEECGLFDNCVVHCLVHNKKPSDRNDERNSQTSENTSSASNQRAGPQLNQNVPGSRRETSESFLNRPENGRWYLYIGMVLITVTLVFCWFCRFNYSYLFSFYSTIGLILMSVLFIAMIPLILLIERDVVN